jgi:DNA polymerase-1
MKKMKVTNLDAYELLHKGTLAFSDIEQNGINIDVPYCERQKKGIQRKIDYFTKKLDLFPEMKKWKKIYGKKFNINSDTQLAKILYTHYSYKTDILTKTGKMSTSEEALLSIKGGAPEIVESLIDIRKLKKSRNTYLQGFITEQVDGVMHPSFDLNKVVTYRSSSQNPNFQNIPIRDPEMKKLLRSAIIPPKDYLLCEIDYSQAEIRMATCYHKDPEMVKEIKDKERDMHRDIAIKCFCLDNDGWNSGTRAAGKSFIFAQFYGDYYVNCANNLWGLIDGQNLHTKNIPMKKHLKNEGIKNINDFTNHIQKVERYFWKKKFKIYDAWKQKQLKKYDKTGYIELLTGFRIEALLSKNEVINWPIQGAAFHCLLWSIIELNNIFKAKEYKSYISGQIHDSIFMYIHPDEINVILPLVRYIMTEKIREHWKWIFVPLDIDIEISPLNKSWYHKKEVGKYDCYVCHSEYMYKDTNEKEEIYTCPVCGSIHKENKGK